MAGAFDFDRHVALLGMTLVSLAGNLLLRAPQVNERKAAPLRLPRQGASHMVRS
jgi:hypothetical protein